MATLETPLTDADVRDAIDPLTGGRYSAVRAETSVRIERKLNEATRLAIENAGLVQNKQKFLEDARQELEAAKQLQRHTLDNVRFFEGIAERLRIENERLTKEIERILEYAAEEAAGEDL